MNFGMFRGREGGREREERGREGGRERERERREERESEGEIYINKWLLQCITT